jgi:hypothetical protein
MDEEPLVSVVRGTPSAEELAALVAVLTSRSSRLSGPSALGTSPNSSLGASAWVRSGRPGAAGRAGGGTWRSSAQPG